MATLKRLLDRNADPTRKGTGRETALHLAAAWEHREAAQLVLARGTKVNACSGRNAAAGGYTAVIVLLLTHQARIA